MSEAALLQIASLLLGAGGGVYLVFQAFSKWWNKRLERIAAEDALKHKELQDELDQRKAEDEAAAQERKVEATAQQAARKLLEEQGLRRIGDLENARQISDQRYDQLFQTQHIRDMAFEVLKNQYDRLEETNKVYAAQILALQTELTQVHQKLDATTLDNQTKAQRIVELEAEILRLQHLLSECEASQ